MELRVERLADGTFRLSWPGQAARCAIGRGGIRRDKREGDGATPVGSFALRRVLYRPDRVPPPVTALEVVPLAPDDGWCDAADDPAYNRPVKLPFAASHEKMWRDDGLYDVVVVLGHNDDPPVPGAGSAIFLHVAKSGYAATEGCVAVPLATLQELLQACRPGDVLAVLGR